MAYLHLYRVQHNSQYIRAIHKSKGTLQALCSTGYHKHPYNDNLQCDIPYSAEHGRDRICTFGSGCRHSHIGVHFLLLQTLENDLPIRCKKTAFGKNAAVQPSSDSEHHVVVDNKRLRQVHDHMDEGRCSKRILLRCLQDTDPFDGSHRNIQQRMEIFRSQRALRRGGRALLFKCV